MPPDPTPPTPETLLPLFRSQHTEHALLLLDPAGVVVGWLGGAERVLGYQADEMLGQDFARLFTPDDRAHGMPGHELRTAEAAGAAHDDRWHVRKDGGRIWAVGVTTALRDDAGRLVGFAKVLRDRTDEKGRIEATASRIEALEAADDRRGRFVAALAHELGNTVFAVGMAIELVRTAVARTPGLSDLLATLSRHVALMRRLVEDLGDVARLGTGKLSLKTGSVVLNEVLERAVETCRPRAEARGQTLDLLLPPAPLAVEADADRLLQVFANLILNAVKYTPEGGEIRVEGTKAGGEAIAKVRDTGVGIGPETLPRIFDLFTQETSSQEMAEGGYGVGLWMVKSLVDLHGGSVAVRSEGKGKGSEFAVRLPLKAARPETAGPEAGRTDASRDRRPCE